MRLVLDPSVAIKFYVPEIFSNVAEALEFSIQNTPHSVSVPSLFYSELGNVVWKKCALRNQISETQGRAIVRAVLKLPFEVVSNEVLLEDALKIAIDFKIALYDAVYLACMRHVKGTLVSADERLINKVKDASWAQSVVFLGDWGKEQT